MARYINEILNRHWCDPEPPLALSGHEIERRELRKRFTQWGGANLVGLLQPPDMHAIARPQRPARTSRLSAARHSSQASTVDWSVSA